MRVCLCVCVSADERVGLLIFQSDFRFYRRRCRRRRGRGQGSQQELDPSEESARRQNFGPLLVDAPCVPGIVPFCTFRIQHRRKKQTKQANKTRKPFKAANFFDSSSFFGGGIFWPASLACWGFLCSVVFSVFSEIFPCYTHLKKKRSQMESIRCPFNTSWRWHPSRFCSLVGSFDLMDWSPFHIIGPIKPHLHKKKAAFFSLSLSLFRFHPQKQFHIEARFFSFFFSLFLVPSSSSCFFFSGFLKQDFLVHRFFLYMCSTLGSDNTLGHNCFS